MIWIISAILILGAAVWGASTFWAMRRWSVWVAAIGVLWEVGWMVLSMIDRLVLPGMGREYVYLIGSIILFGMVIGSKRTWNLPRRIKENWKKEAVVVAVTATVLLGAMPVLYRNGWQDGAWVAHGYYNGDTATFQALVQGSLTTPGLFQRNPFAASEELEYPTFIHGSIATFIQALGLSEKWLVWLPWMVLGQITVTIPLMFFVYDAFNGRKGKKEYLPATFLALVALYVLGTSWDNFIYPQSHFFLTGIFLLLAGHLAHTQTLKEPGSVRDAIVTFLLALILIPANAVTGTAALVMVWAAYGLQVINTNNSMLTRVGFAGGVIALGAVFLGLTPGQGSLSIMPGFSYTAALDAMKLAPILILVFAGAGMLFRKSSVPIAIGTSLLALGLVALTFSQRDIVVANASRFWYHAVLLLWPLGAAAGWAVWHYSLSMWPSIKRNRIDRVIYAGTGLGLLALMLMPVWSSVAVAYDSLLRLDEKKVSRAEVEALRWLQKETNNEAVFAQNPDSFWSIPVFTGRTLLRTDYWLSPNDKVLADMRAAYRGDDNAQQEMQSQVDFVWLKTDELPSWQNVLKGKTPVFSNAEVSIY